MHKLRVLACFCLVLAASKTNFNSLLEVAGLVLEGGYSIRGAVDAMGVGKTTVRSLRSG